MNSGKIIWGGLIVAILLAPAAWAQEASVRAKQFPPGHFYSYLKAPLAEKAQVLAKLDATLKKLNQDGYGLIVKGAVIDRLDTTRPVYEKLAILDDSGLIIVARRVPNLYYRYPDPAAINPNLYLVIKNPRVNVPECYIRYGLVVEGDYAAYVQKFVTAIIENLEGASPKPEKEPAAPLMKNPKK